MRPNVMSIRFSNTERALVVAGAARQGLTVSELIRRAVVAELRWLAPPEICELLSEPLEKEKREGPAA